MFETWGHWLSVSVSGRARPMAGNVVYTQHMRPCRNALGNLWGTPEPGVASLGGPDPTSTSRPSPRKVSKLFRTSAIPSICQASSFKKLGAFLAHAEDFAG